MSYIHIKPTFNCLLKIDSLEKALDKNKTYSFLSKVDSLNIVVYPLNSSSSSLPYSFKFNVNDPICQKNVDVISFPNDNFLLTISPFYVGSPKYLGVKSKSLNFGGNSHTLYYTLNTYFNIKIENYFTSCEYSFQEKIENLNTVTVENNVLIYAKIQNNQGYVFCNISFENNAYSLITLEKINLLEAKPNCIYTYKNLNDISHHGEVNKYETSKNYKRVSYIVYESNFPIVVKHKELIPFAFFEAIKLKNFNLARSYMASSLSNRLTNSHLQSFFNNFIDVTLPLKHEVFEEEISLVYKTETSDFQTKKFAKNYKIVINSNNKIENILEL